MEMILRPEVLIFLIPIVAIVIGGVVALSKIWIRHRERMAMIAAGIHPDERPDENIDDDEA
jgi:hypothetical protein